VRDRVNARRAAKPNFLAFKIAAAFFAVALACWPAWPQASPEDEWVAKYFPIAFEEFFPIQKAEGDFLAVRVHRSGLNDLPEYSIVLEDAQDPHSVRALVREAQGMSLYQQLAALHAAQPSASYDELKREIKVGRWTLSSADCPAVSRQLKAYENIDFVRPRDEDEPDENPILYEFNETLDGGGSVLEYLENRALPRWARATRQALDACISSAKRPPYGW
jgi:hypothetical protein